MNETEDHIACLFEVMRYLIAGDDVATSRQPGGAAALSSTPMSCAAWSIHCAMPIALIPKAADFYAALARFTRDFGAVEAQASTCSALMQW
jgi:TorA maturation chaperone TorD